MRNRQFLILAAFALALVGCSQDAAKVADDPNAAAPTKVEKPAGAAEVGSAELSPGMSASEADARVGSANK